MTELQCECGEWDKKDYCVKCGKHFTDQWDVLIATIKQQTRSIERLQGQLEERNKGIRHQQAKIEALREEVAELREANAKVGTWFSAALEDPKVCESMKADLNEWFMVTKPEPQGV